MINGRVSGLQARIAIVIYPPGYPALEIECVVDTGFEGFLTLPPDAIAKLGLPYIAPLDANLADNSRIVTNVHQGTILWNGVERNIPILAMGRRPLLGTALLADSHQRSNATIPCRAVSSSRVRSQHSSSIRIQTD